MNQDPAASNPLITVIMPAYNAEKTIVQAIQSVIDQTYDRWELIVVDDGSTDNTATAVQSFSDQRIRLLSQENGGQSAARNFGIKQAAGKYITFLDADDQWLDEKLSEQIKVFTSATVELGLVHTGYLEFDDIKEFTPKPQRFVKKKQLSGRVYHDLLIHNFIGVLSVMVPKKILDEVGCFDKELINSPDWDLWLRITKKYPIAYIDRPLARYRLNPAGLSKNYENYAKNLWKLLERHLLAADLPKSKKNKGLWLYYRHMAHGFARNGDFRNAILNLKHTIQIMPLSIHNLLSIVYIASQYLKQLTK